MRKFKKALAAAVLATAVAGGGYAFLGSALVPAAQARLKDHPKLLHAHDALKDADEYLTQSPAEFMGHKAEALRAIRKALREIEICAGEDERSTDGNFDPQPLAHVRLEKAREALKAARVELEEAKADYHHHREEAVKAIDEALHQIDVCIQVG